MNSDNGIETDSPAQPEALKPSPEMWQDREKIIGQSIGKALWSLALPAVLSTFFTIIFEIIDMFWIGRLGAVSIAGFGAASFFVWMLRGLGLVVATGTIAMISRRSGEKNEPGLLTTIFNSIGATLLFTVIILAFFFPMGVNIFHWLKLEASVGAAAEDFSIIFLSGLIFVYFMTVFEFIIRGVGDTKTPMIITGISLLLNAILDPIFIFPLGFGLTGAAYATILAQAVGAVLMSMVLLKKIPALKKMDVSKYATSIKEFFRQFYSIVAIGGPTGLSDAGFSMIYLLLSGIISIFGKEPLAAVGIAHRIEALPFFICLGFSMAVAPMVGQYLGAGEAEKAKQTVYLSLKITVTVILAISVLFFLFAPALFGFFTKDAAIIAHGAKYLRIIAIFEVFLALEVVLGGAFSGAGDTKPPFFIVFPITALRIPAAYLMAVTFDMGIQAVWIVISVTTFLKGSLLLFWFKKGRWAKKQV